MAAKLCVGQVAGRGSSLAVACVVVVAAMLLAGCAMNEPYRVVETQSGNQYDDVPEAYPTF